MSIPNTNKTHGKTKHLWTVSAPLQLWLTFIPGVITCPPNFICTCKTKFLHLTNWFLALSPHHFWRSNPPYHPLSGKHLVNLDLKRAKTTEAPPRAFSCTMVPCESKMINLGASVIQCAVKSFTMISLGSTNPTKTGKRKHRKGTDLYGAGEHPIRATSVLKHTLFHGDGCKSRDLENSEKWWNMFATQQNWGKARDWWWFMWFKCAEG